MAELFFKWCHFFRSGRKRNPATHCHDWDELVVFTEGIYYAEMGAEKFQAGPGDVVLFRAGQTHWEVNDTEQPPAFYVITFKGEDRLVGFPPLMQDRQGRIRTLCQWLNEQWWWETRYNQAYPRGLLEAILAELRHTAWTAANPFVESVRRYLVDHLSEPLTTAMLARHFGMSRSHFCRQYRKEAQRAPMAELRRTRLFQARTLLQTTNLPTKAIARQIGLSGEAALSHLFQKNMKATPSSVRRGVGKTKAELQSQFDRGEKDY